jgi:16S rRNA (cytosine1402-N4)-methyltransferase
VAPDAFHIPVLCREAVDALVTDTEGCYVDGTVGGGGHAEEMCLRLQGRGRLICIDADEEALASARARLQPFAARTLFLHTNFGDLGPVLHRTGITRVHGILLDLGVSSHQFDVPERGFSFRGDERLDMRLDRRQHLTAWDLVNNADQDQLADVLHDYGEERQARRIARRIIDGRPVNTTGELKEIIERAVGGQHLTKTLARIFQALRIAVNRELDALQSVLQQAVPVLHPGGRLVVIAYHSLEDRSVKSFFRTEAESGADRHNPFVRGPAAEGRLRLVTRKAVVPSDEEIARNPRARSAKMRVAERTDVGTEHT